MYFKLYKHLFLNVYQFGNVLQQQYHVIFKFYFTHFLFLLQLAVIYYSQSIKL